MPSRGTKQVSHSLHDLPLEESWTQLIFLNEVTVRIDFAFIYRDKKKGVTHPRLAEFFSLSYFSLIHKAAVMATQSEF